MGAKTNCIKNGIEYYRIRRKVGKKVNNKGKWVDDYKEFYGKSKKEAEQKYRDFMKKKEAGISGEKQYFGIIADQFIYNIFLKDSNIAETTKEKYVTAWETYIKPSMLAGQLLDQINSLSLQELYNNLDCSKSALKSIHNLMRAFYKYLEKNGYCRDMTGSLVLPRKNEAVAADFDKENEIVIWEDNEIKTILKNSAGHRLRLFIILALYTGGRISELLALKYSDIEDHMIRFNKQLINKPEIKKGEKKTHSLQISQTKTPASIRTVPITDQVLEEIAFHKAWHRKEMMKNGYRTEFIFTTKSGGFCDRQNVSRALSRLYKKIGVPNKSPHTYRRTFGTNLCKAKIPIQTAAVLMGHTSINVTAKYYINIDMEQKQEAISRLENMFM